LTKISHNLESLDKKIDSLSRDESAAAITVSRDDMIIYGTRFKQLLGQEFGYNEIYDHNLEYFVERYPLRYRLVKEALELECTKGIPFNAAYERLKSSWKQARHLSGR